MSFKLIQTLAIVAVGFCTLHFSRVNADSGAVRLSDVKVLTLHNGKMTNGRRSSPVPQLKCSGGSAGCNAFTPQVVQCYNRGFDGIDYQWECKTDMDNAYRFGQISVSCEGFSYPSDPYILKGSCGLEYTIDLTEEGYARQQRKDHCSHEKNVKSHYGEKKPCDVAPPGRQQSTMNDNHHEARIKLGTVKESPRDWQNYRDIFCFVLILVVLFLVVVDCLSCEESVTSSSNEYTTSNDAGGHPGSNRGAPPPPGFRPEVYPDAIPKSSPSAENDQSASTGPSSGAGGEPATEFLCMRFPLNAISGMRGWTNDGDSPDVTHETSKKRWYKSSTRIHNRKHEQPSSEPSFDTSDGAYEQRSNASPTSTTSCSSEKRREGSAVGTSTRSNEQLSKESSTENSGCTPEHRFDSSDNSTSSCTDKQSSRIGTEQISGIRSCGTRTASGFGGTKRR